VHYKLLSTISAIDTVFFNVVMIDYMQSICAFFADYPFCIAESSSSSFRALSLTSASYCFELPNIPNITFTPSSYPVDQKWLFYHHYW